jgi:hypothetical protein
VTLAKLFLEGTRYARSAPIFIALVDLSFFTHGELIVVVVVADLHCHNTRPPSTTHLTSKLETRPRETLPASTEGASTLLRHDNLKSFRKQH